MAQDALCQTLGKLLPSEEHRVVPLLSLLAARINVDDRDSEALKSLTGIAMWLALAKQNPWAISYADRICERPDQFSYSLSYAVFGLYPGFQLMKSANKAVPGRFRRLS